MKSILCWISLSLAVGCLAAQVADEETVIPTEPAEPPYEEGDLLDDAGHTIDREDRPDLNFRIVDNRIRLYWLDEDRLIVEPEVDEATLRFRGTVRGRAFHRLTRLSGDLGLGTPTIMPPPHIYQVILFVGTDAEGEPESYAFRYTADMDPAEGCD